MDGFMSTQEFTPCLLYSSSLFAGVFVSRNYPESDLQGGVEHWRALFGWAPVRIQRREVAGGRRGEAWPRQHLCRGFRRPLRISHTPSVRNFSGAREGLGASGEPQFCAGCPRPAKWRQNQAKLLSYEALGLFSHSAPVAGPGPL